MKKPSWIITVSKTLLLGLAVFSCGAITPLQATAAPANYSPALAPQNEAIQISLNPANHLNGQTVIEKYEIKPTQSADGVLTIKNHSLENTVSLKLYAVDSTSATNGGMGYKLATESQNNLGQWLKFSKNELILQPDQEIKTPYTIAIPAKITPGTYQGGLVAEIINIGSVKRTNGDIKIVSRLIEPIIVSIPGRKIASYVLDDFSLKYLNGLPNFNYSLRNTGNVFLKIDPVIGLTGTLLNAPFQLDGGSATVLQDDTYNKQLLWLNARFFGQYHATLKLKISQFNFASGEFKELETITREISFYIIPWFTILTILFIIIVIGALAYYYGRRCQIERANTFTHLVKKGETISSIAELYQIDWKEIVHLNKLKKPYSLRSGKRLILPLPKIPS